LKRIEVPAIEIVREITEHYFGKRVELERVTKGSSTYVFRIFTDHQTFYLRILPEQAASFDAEVKVLRLLRSKGVNVPNVIYYELRNHLIGLSIMVTEELLGSDLDQPNLEIDHDNLAQILYYAGEQIALVNQIELKGFGEIDRAVNATLTGEHESMRGYYEEFLEHDLSILHHYGLQDHSINVVRTALEEGFEFINEQRAYLAHGDFDTSHIFQHHGAYSGIIDFGDIKAVSARYDLGHFKTHDFLGGYEALLSGYNNVRKLSERDKAEITLWALFIAVRRLGMIHGRPKGFYHAHLSQSIKTTITEWQRLR